MSRSQSVPYIWKKVEFLGHVVFADSVSVQTSKIGAVGGFASTSTTELKVFLVWWIFIASLFKVLLRVAAPLSDIFHGKKSFKFGT